MLVCSKTKDGGCIVKKGKNFKWDVITFVCSLVVIGHCTVIFSGYISDYLRKKENVTEGVSLDNSTIYLLYRDTVYNYSVPRTLTGKDSEGQIEDILKQILQNVSDKSDEVEQFKKNTRRSYVYNVTSKGKNSENVHPESDEVEQSKKNYGRSYVYNVTSKGKNSENVHPESDEVEQSKKNYGRSYVYNVTSKNKNSKKVHPESDEAKQSKKSYGRSYVYNVTSKNKNFEKVHPESDEAEQSKKNYGRSYVYNVTSKNKNSEKVRLEINNIEEHKFFLNVSETGSSTSSNNSDLLQTLLHFMMYDVPQSFQALGMQAKQFGSDNFTVNITAFFKYVDDDASIFEAKNDTITSVKPKGEDDRIDKSSHKKKKKKHSIPNKKDINLHERHHESKPAQHKQHEPVIPSTSNEVTQNDTYLLNFDFGTEEITHYEFVTTKSSDFVPSIIEEIDPKTKNQNEPKIAELASMKAPGVIPSQESTVILTANFTDKVFYKFLELFEKGNEIFHRFYREYNGDIQPRLVTNEKDQAKATRGHKSGSRKRRNSRKLRDKMSADGPSRHDYHTNTYRKRSDSRIRRSADVTNERQNKLTQDLTQSNTDLIKAFDSSDAGSKQLEGMNKISNTFSRKHKLRKREVMNERNEKNDFKSQSDDENRRNLQKRFVFNSEIGDVSELGIVGNTEEEEEEEEQEQEQEEEEEEEEEEEDRKELTAITDDKSKRFYMKLDDDKIGHSISEEEEVQLEDQENSEAKKKRQIFEFGAADDENVKELYDLDETRRRKNSDNVDMWRYDRVRKAAGSAAPNTTGGPTATGGPSETTGIGASTTAAAGGEESGTTKPSEESKHEESKHEDHHGKKKNQKKKKTKAKSKSAPATTAAPKAKPTTTAEPSEGINFFHSARDDAGIVSEDFDIESKRSLSSSLYERSILNDDDDDDDDDDDEDDDDDDYDDDYATDLDDDVSIKELMAMKGFKDLDKLAGMKGLKDDKKGMKDDKENIDENSEMIIFEDDDESMRDVDITQDRKARFYINVENDASKSKSGTGREKRNPMDREYDIRPYKVTYGEQSDRHRHRRQEDDQKLYSVQLQA